MALVQFIVSYSLSPFFLGGVQRENSFCKNQKKFTFRYFS